MDVENKELFWDADLEELKKGIVEEDAEYRCIICEASFEKGRIYEFEEKLYNAEKFAHMHVEKEHDSMLSYLINMNSSFTGLTDIQRRVLALIGSGLTDKEIAKELGVASSTIRNHRYKFRQKEKQAKIFLTLMELISENTNKKIIKLEDEKLCDSHKTARAIDDRYNITDKEKKSTIKNYMDETGALKTFPSKAKKKIIILEAITQNFSKGKIYSEKEINRILKRIYEDYVTIRRALIEYGFVDRTDDCKSYWVKE
ncbi:MAG: DUF2087 domain-containing protein [Tissierellales bacterium]|nr:DUF2087 domain-containing protein [Tissierellales bacterium]